MRKKTVLSAILFAIVFSMLIPLLAYAPAGVECSPASYDVELTSHSQQLKDLRVMNSGNKEEQMTIVVGALGQNIDGNAIIIEDPEIVKTVAPYFVITPNKFVLKPGEKKYVKVQMNIPADKQGGVYAVLSTTGVPTRRKVGPGQFQAPSNARIGVLMMLGLPGGIIDGEIEGLIIDDLKRTKAINQEEAEALKQKKEIPYRYNLKPVIRNTGNKHWKPSRGYVKVLTKQGEEIGRPNIVSQNILPGYRRTFDCFWSLNQPLPDGDYYAEAHVWVPRTPEKELVAGEWFRIRGGLATRDGEIIDMRPQVVAPNKSFRLQTKCKNTGSLPYVPTVKMTVFKGKNVVIKTEDIKVTTSLYNPKESKWFPTNLLKGLSLGMYRVNIKLSYNGKTDDLTIKDQLFDEKEFPLLVRQPEPWWKAFWRWLTKLWWLWLILVIIAIIILLLWWQRRRHKKEMEEMHRRRRMPMMRPPMRPRR